MYVEAKSKKNNSQFKHQEENQKILPYLGKEFSELNFLKYFKKQLPIEVCLHNGDQPLLKLPKKGTHHGEMKNKLTCCPETTGAQTTVNFTLLSSQQS